jgi:hypothetical protein
MRARSCLLFAALGSLIAASCEFPQAADEVEPVSSRTGTMLVRLGGYLYRLGGAGPDGSASAAVQVARLAEDGGLGSAWADEAPLPEPLAHGMALASANFLYVIGGESADGVLSDAIWYAYVDPLSGELGFGAGPVWIRGERSLPEPLSRAACVLHEGCIYLAGGRGTDGASSKLLYARLYRDGFVGYWYASKEGLPSPMSDAAAAIDLSAGEASATLVVAGGESGGGSIADLASFAIGSWGELAAPSLSSLPLALTGPLLACDEGSLLLAGGDGDNLSSEAVHRRQGGCWILETDESLAAEGPSFARAAGKLLFLFRETAESREATVGTRDFGLAPERPEILPRSGLVRTGTYIRARREPGTVLRYRASTSGVVEEVGPEDPAWTSSLQIAGPLNIAFRAFGAGGSVSPIAHRSYRISPVSSIEEAPELTLGDDEGIGTAVVQPGWYSFAIDEPGRIALAWSDPSSAGTGSLAVSVSVFETDLCTPVPDRRTDLPATELIAGESPARFDLMAGKYFVEAAVLAPAAAGEGFRILVYRED